MGCFLLVLPVTPLTADPERALPDRLGFVVTACKSCEKSSGNVGGVGADNKGRVWCDCLYKNGQTMHSYHTNHGRKTTE